MKITHFLITFFGLSFTIGNVAYGIEQSPKFTNREIVEKSEKSAETGKKQANQRITDQTEFNQRFEAADQRFDIMYKLTFGGFCVLAMGIYGLIGFIAWDRRRAANRIKKIAREEAEQYHQDLLIIKEIIRRLGKNDPELRPMINRLN